MRIGTKRKKYFESMKRKGMIHLRLMQRRLVLKKLAHS
jgi:hypothetical protein